VINTQKQIRDKQDAELDNLTNIRSQLQQYNDWEKTLYDLQRSLTTHSSFDSLQEYKTLEILLLNKQDILKNYDSLEQCIKHYDLWIEHNMSTLKITDTQISIQKCLMDIHVLEEKRDQQIQLAKTIDEYKQYQTLYHKKCFTLTQIMDQFTYFKDWCIEQKIIPIIVDQVNLLLQTICLNHRDIKLLCSLDMTTKSFIWLVQDTGYSLPFEKVSGFQKCAINLAMRITLGKLGVSGMKNAQLFIDEGFTSCDYENLENVPYVLHNLLHLYKSIFIVTHLEDLKQKITSSIDIHRNEFNGLSHINLGPINHNFDTR
jgi:DNA repair exonuclease SbcCD ATPase subunit